VFVWTPPSNNGSDITGYQLECHCTRVGSSEVPWTPAPLLLSVSRACAVQVDDGLFTIHLPPHPATARIDKVITGNAYRFRISAQSQVGVGTASEWTTEVHCSPGAGGEMPNQET
jgi:hypothetical protein